MRYRLITLVLFIASATFWYLGMRNSAALAMAAGGALELVAWKRLIKGRKSA
jgi:hypothetical protein